MRRLVVAVGGLLTLVALALQLVPPEYPRDNPSVTAPITGPPQVVAVLRRACFDCHSNETRWPFYAWVAPISWAVAADVAGGRSRMNLSEWETLRIGFKRRFSRKIVERLEKGEMPLPRYRWFHPRAHVTASELETLRQWRDHLASE